MDANDYTIEDPVKMIDIRYTNERFAATEHLTHGTEWRKEDAIRTPADHLNKLPPLWYVLYPSDGANFSLPVKPGEEILTVYTGRKGSANSSQIVIKVRSGDEMECQIQNSHSVTSCSLNIAEYVKEALEENNMLEVEISVPGESQGSASIWELDLNNSSDDVQVQGFFEEDARNVLKSTKEAYGDDTSLSMVTFVGSKQVGKSTIASLLSGNDKMFQYSDSGVNISNFIPSENYAERMASVIDCPTCSPPSESVPLFFIDTEAMGMRGESFEFISASTPSLISKMIVWVDDHNGYDADKILHDIDGYITHLTKVVTENSYEGDKDCQNVTFGKFNIVVNKMTDDLPDNILEENLLAIEAGLSTDARERDRIRERIRKCFNGYSALGLPLITTNEHVTLTR